MKSKSNHKTEKNKIKSGKIDFFFILKLKMKIR